MRPTAFRSIINICTRMPEDPSGGINSFESGYSLRTGQRTGDGITAPDGPYDGNYLEDYEYVAAGAELDECGGRHGVTPEYPNGTYYYVLTDNWPWIPRCLKGEYVDNSFRLGQNCPASTAEDDCSQIVSGIDDPESIFELNIFPNPTKDYIVIKLQGSNVPVQIDHLTVYDVNGL